MMRYPIGIGIALMLMASAATAASKSPNPLIWSLSWYNGQINDENYIPGLGGLKNTDYSGFELAMTAYLKRFFVTAEISSGTQEVPKSVLRLSEYALKYEENLSIRSYGVGVGTVLSDDFLDINNGSGFQHSLEVSYSLTKVKNRYYLYDYINNYYINESFAYFFDESVDRENLGLSYAFGIGLGSGYSLRSGVSVIESTGDKLEKAVRGAGIGLRLTKSFAQNFLIGMGLFYSESDSDSTASSLRIGIGYAH